MSLASNDTLHDWYTMPPTAEYLPPLPAHPPDDRVKSAPLKPASP